MSPTSTLEAGLPERYYAPEFLLEVGGEELDPASKGDVLEIKVEMEVGKLTTATVKVNNYDDTTFDLKWTESDTFRLGNSVHLQMGYAERLVSMVRGPITTLAPEFVSDAAPTLSVTLTDALVRLKGAKPPEDEVTYHDKQDWQIAQAIAERHQLRIEVTEEGPVHPVVVQGDKDDATFLLERAARIDFEVFMRTDPETGDDVLHFVRPSDGRNADEMRIYSLAWGTLRNTDVAPSMVEFKPTITAGDQVSSVTVRGWDPETKQSITYTASPEDTEGVSGDAAATGPAAATELSAGGQGRNETVIDAPVSSEEEARELAESLLTRRSYEFLTGKGKTIGLPDLRPGDNVDIHGVGARFGGQYFVTSVTHTLDAKGFLTELGVRRTYQGELP